MKQATEGENSQIILYADGACSGNPGPGGWGVILKHSASGKIKKISGGERQTTNNRMELTAVIKGLEAVSKPSSVTVITDSQYLVKGMTEWIQAWLEKNWKTSGKKPVKNVELWQRLLELADQHQIQWQWVQGHAGHPENEQCDSMAVAEAAKLIEH